MARDFLAIPGTSVSGERLFSSARHLCHECWALLKLKTIMEAMLTKMWIKLCLPAQMPLPRESSRYLLDIPNALPPRLSLSKICLDVALDLHLLAHGKIFHLVALVVRRISMLLDIIQYFSYLGIDIFKNWTIFKAGFSF
ncbi:hypothetical protein B0H19DRAFT_1277040 [Mycena capillaripes]|nr:hypothetical protein B0H19DRAFT_1277040 [Mycena capillaripes]